MNWFKMSEEERAATAFGTDMARIDAALAILFERRTVEFSVVESTKGQDFAGVVGKLAVASRFLADEDSEAAKLVAGALADLKDLGSARP
jgi:hypothetical protein